MPDRKRRQGGGGGQAPADVVRKAREAVGEGKCLCGCGGEPAGERSRFVPGHDGKLRHAVMAWRDGTSSDKPLPEQLQYARTCWGMNDV
jgi:hypothetical protein